MLLLSGYTLGFFFPKQTRHLATSATTTSRDEKAAAGRLDLAETRPDPDPERLEVPASLYFYRYF